ncbi:RluA family pseudouridine synthase [Hominifimenecus sp. rT4P-3]|uniref:RluA family pseudouridine synthase n=1 Tax=Hominifimenecus sp. rT4P-3 TaxID=3242979 RepID=UPI003DA572DB
MDRVVEYRIDQKDAGKSVGQALSSCLELSGRQIRRLKFQPDGILLNGKRTRTNALVQAGDRLTVVIREERGCDLIPVDGDVAVIYEDLDLVVVNKPSGLVVHPSPGHYSDSLLNWLAGMGFHGLHLSGRLDRDTSGLVVLAKNGTTISRLARQKEDGRFQKRYLALVSGHLFPKNGRIQTPLGKASGGGMRMQVAEDGKAASTWYDVVQEYETYSLVSFKLDTGRTHQIRVHMASMGHPLLGDPLYGTPDVRLGRAALHAAEIWMEQPFSSAPLHWKVSLPADMQAFMRN